MVWCAAMLGCFTAIPNVTKSGSTLLVWHRAPLSRHSHIIGEAARPWSLLQTICSLSRLFIHLSWHALCRLENGNIVRWFARILLPRKVRVGSYCCYRGFRVLAKECQFWNLEFLHNRKSLTVEWITPVRMLFTRRENARANILPSCHFRTMTTTGRWWWPGATWCGLPFFGLQFHSARLGTSFRLGLQKSFLLIFFFAAFALLLLCQLFLEWIQNCMPSFHWMPSRFGVCGSYSFRKICSLSRGEMLYILLLGGQAEVEFG